MNFEEKICEWVETDNTIRAMNEKLRNERSKRNTLGENILNYAVENNIQDSIVQITDGKLKFQNAKTTPPLTYKYVRECLEKCLNEETAVQLINYMKENREIKYSPEVKRYYN